MEAGEARALLDFKDEDMTAADMIRSLIHLAVVSDAELETLKDDALVYELADGIHAVTRMLIGRKSNGDELCGIGRTYFLSELGLNRSELLELARSNSARLYPARLLPLGTALGARATSNEDELQEEIPLFVVLNGTNGGAAALFYDGEMDRIAGQLGCSYYCIPSSVHEWMIVPLTVPEELTPDDMRAMIRDINAAGAEVGVSPENKMSDELYMYDMHQHSFGIVR